MADLTFSRLGLSVLRNVLSGSVVGIVLLTYGASYAVVIFSGPLAEGLSLGMNSVLVGAALVCLVVSLLSSVPLAVGGPDTATVAVLGALAAGVAGRALAGAGAEIMVPLVLSGIFAGTLLTGLVLGVAASCLFFAFTYSRVDVIKHSLTRREYRSNFERSPAQARLLYEQGDRIWILWLQGYIFFGTSNRVFEHVIREIAVRHDHPVHWLVLDFDRVSGIDSSAVLSFVKLRNYAEQAGVTLIFSGLSQPLAKALDAYGPDADAEAGFAAFSTLDEALERCEEALLGGAAGARDDEPAFRAWLGRELGGEAHVAALLGFLERRDLAAGDTLVRQGEATDDMYLVRSGRVTVLLEEDGRPPVRLQSMIGHTLIGEMGFYRETSRSASVVADEPTVVYRLSRSALAEMQRLEGATCAAFQGLIIRALAERLDFANHEISALLR